MRPECRQLLLLHSLGEFLLFYRDFRASESLMLRGEVESDLEFFQLLDTADTMTVETVE